MLLTATGFLNDFDALKEAQLKTINIQSAAALPQRQKEVIWNVLGLWGPLGAKKREFRYSHKLRSKRFMSSETAICGWVFQ